jgi:hypothetical protein
MEDRKIVENDDNEYLDPLDVIGDVDEVNGADAQQVSGFVPTRYELFQLAKYWQQVWLENVYFMYWSSCLGGREQRLKYVAQGRLKRIADAIGDDLVDSAENEVNEEFGKGCDPRIWNLFRNNLPLPEKVAEKFARAEKATDADWEGTDISQAEPDHAASPGTAEDF